MLDGEPLVRWRWLGDHLGYLADLTADHAVIALVPVLLGLLLAVPLGLACARFPRLYQPLAAVFNVVYALPSLAVFVVLIPYTGLATRETVMVPLTCYALAVLLPTAVDGLRAVPEPVRQAAAAMGYGPWRRLAAVELPASVPYLIGGLRVAAVSSISLAAVGALVGRGGLGYLFVDGFQRTFPTPILAGIALVALLALATDLLLVAARRVLAPWARGVAR
ncbi:MULTISPECIES: ABC transporter permease subunit [Kitasatospora]|uniref:Putative osmoprotectant ABC transporter permease protein n=1 Tax=Kitasatospora setae (strain ATCC 33774 / DSM 43861 / JCM 3304 / KCC A-0304 / NBRC 14216 / KM-6054) TaxID=452652 RepID=E4N1C5_KITSK|nr:MULTISPECIES: ABC transporter permease subunit [Kitasatospora]BAJ31959.1 putative osmoprotectant ABC transporter permease protein [Kitasatospora setae KM-6054]